MYVSFNFFFLSQCGMSLVWIKENIYLLYDIWYEDVQFSSCSLIPDKLNVFTQILAWAWPKPQRTCNAMVTSQTQHSTYTRKYYAVIQRAQCWWATTFRLPRRGIEPRPSGFRDIGSTSRPSPLLIDIEPQPSSQKLIRNRTASRSRSDGRSLRYVQYRADQFQDKDHNH